MAFVALTEHCPKLRKIDLDCLNISDQTLSSVSIQYLVVFVIALIVKLIQFHFSSACLALEGIGISQYLSDH